MIEDDLSPIELEIQRIVNRVEQACGSSYYYCNECGEKGKGFSNLKDGTFTCLRCYVKKEAERLDSDPEWIKKDKVWNLRRAIRDHKVQSMQGAVLP